MPLFGDLDIDGFSSDVLEIFDPTGYPDTWTPRQPTRHARGQHRDRRKFRVRDLNSTSAKGDLNLLEKSAHACAE